MEIMFLLLLALIWLIIASVSDLKKREIPNWLSFSLIIFSLGFRLIYSVFNADYMFFLYGLFGFVVFFILAYLFYYARIFAGGDSKLLMGLGGVIPLASSFYINLLLLFIFIFILLFIGGIYGLFFSVVLVNLNREKFSKEFKKQFKMRRWMVLIGLIFSVLTLFLVFYVDQVVLFLLPLIIFVLPFLFIFGKSIEESCMVKQVSVNKLTVGDWLYETVKVGKKRIKPDWEGLNDDELEILRKLGGNKKVKIKQGIPFVPCFLISFLVFILGNSYWGFF